MTSVSAWRTTGSLERVLGTEVFAVDSGAVDDLVLLIRQGRGDRLLPS